jgi:hypothetical protein
MKPYAEILCESFVCTRARHEMTNSRPIATKFFQDRDPLYPLAHAYCQDCFNVLFGPKRFNSSFEELTYEEYLINKIMLA